MRAIDFKEEYAVVIGGTNIDIIGIPKNKLIYHDSNIGNVKTSLGGVGRNIGENLSKLGANTHLISVIGDDHYGELIKEHSEEIGLNIGNSLTLEGEATSVYLSILDEEGDMEIALSSMDNIEKMDIGFIETKREIIENSKVCVIDTNIPKATIEYILKNYKATDFFLDTVSTEKAKKVIDLISYFHTIKPNKIEAEKLSGIEIKSDEDLESVIEYFHIKGVKNVFITLSKDGVIFSDGKKIERLKANPIGIINATGAGDAFIAAISYGHLNDLSIREKAKLGIGASLLALSHEDTINPSMAIENIYNKLEEINLC